jgi:hypothetical protein
MPETARLNCEVTNNQRRLISDHLCTLEESCLRLLELLRPFDSSLVRRQPLPHEKAERLQCLAARLRSRLPQAACDFGLQRIHRDPWREARSLVATMHEHLRELRQLRNGREILDGPREYLETLTDDLQHIVTEIAREVGPPFSEIVADRGRGTGA